MSNEEKNLNEQKQTEQKGTSNRFKKAAERQKKPAGGKPEELTAGANVPAGESHVEVPEIPVVHEQVAPPQPVVEEKQPEKKAAAPALAMAYEATLPAKPEPRTARLNVVITPSLDKKLNDLAKGRIPGRQIQSKNDLMNYLLTRYFEEIGVYD